MDGCRRREYVKVAKAGGFCQFCHGRETPVRKLSAGDGVVYYSPRERMDEGAQSRLHGNRRVSAAFRWLMAAISDV